jgi:hypothetical protein
MYIMGNKNATNNKPKPKPTYDVDHLKDFYGRDGDQTNETKEPIYQTETLYIHGMTLPYMRTDPNFGARMNESTKIDSEAITEIELMVCGPEGKELSEHYRMHPFLHKCGDNCYCMKKVIMPHQGSVGQRMQQIQDVVNREIHHDLMLPMKTNQEISPTSSVSFNMPPEMKGGQYSSSTTTSSSSFDIPKLSSSSSTESEGFVFSDSSLSSSALYRMQSRVYGGESDSEPRSDSTYTERVGHAIKRMEFDKNLFSSESKEILGLESSSEKYIQKKHKSNPKYQSSKKTHGK